MQSLSTFIRTPVVIAMPRAGWGWKILAKSPSRETMYADIKAATSSTQIT